MQLPLLVLLQHRVAWWAAHCPAVHDLLLQAAASTHHQTGMRHLLLQIAAWPCSSQGNTMYNSTSRQLSSCMPLNNRGSCRRWGHTHAMKESCCAKVLMPRMCLKPYSAPV